MLVLALIASVAMTTVSDEPRWVDQQRSFGALGGFLVRADVHVSEAERAGVSKEAIEAQISDALRRNGIPVAQRGRDPGLAGHGVGSLIIDVHVLSSHGRAAVAWGLHVSQPVRLPSGAWTFGSTWEVGDLVEAPVQDVVTRFRDNLEPAVQEFCAAYLASRPATFRAPEPPPTHEAVDL